MSRSPIVIFCLLISHEKVIISPAFCVRLESDEYTSILKKKVKNKTQNPLKNVDAMDLTVWKLSRPRPSEELTPTFVSSIQYVDERSESVNQDQTAFQLYGEEIIGEQGPWPDDEVIHVLVQCPAIDKIAEPLRKKQKTDDVSFDDPARDHERFIEAQKHDVELACTALAPSTAATIPAFVGEQQTRPILIGRPFHNYGFPIGLFHPVFNLFHSVMRSKEPIYPDTRIYSSVRELWNAFAGIYHREEDRIEAITPPLAKLLDDTFQVREISGTKSNGIMIEPCGLSTVYLVIEEVNNEIGMGQADPCNQGGLAYRKYWATQTAIRKLSHCPSIILAIAGPWMCVLGAIYLEKAVVQPLTNYIWLGGNVYDDEEQLLMTARLFGALKTAISSLRTYYRGISNRAGEPNLQAEVSKFPFITEYDSTKFTYVSRLASDYYLGKLLYEAKLDDGQRVVVKFASRYHAEAHRLLAERGLAPKLHHSSTEGGSLYGGRYMVVMDFFEGKMPHTLSEGQFNRVKEAIDLLHSHGIVFGDLRILNVLAKGEDVVLIDFDWCGKEGEARYPVGINMAPELCWPQGVGPAPSPPVSPSLFLMPGPVRPPRPTGACSSPCPDMTHLRSFVISIKSASTVNVGRDDFLNRSPSSQCHVPITATVKHGKKRLSWLLSISVKRARINLTLTTYKALSDSALGRTSVTWWFNQY
ncbi:hypothetical protein C0992_008871 [Termitomyces sp. T32_za158]|nr:hypothetical protein C0992_008871 [Termitomyces sp. T32_za158]